MRPDKSFLLVLAGLAAALSLAPSAAAAIAPSAAKPTRTSAHGLAFLKNEEGFSAKAFPDGKTLTGKQLYSIGYGHQLVSGDGLTPSSVITPAQGEALLAQDVQSREQAIADSVRVPINQNQYDALVSFGYNIGIAGFKSSEVVKRLNAGDYAGAADVWTKYWTKSEGVTHPVLVARRQREAALFRSA